MSYPKSLKHWPYAHLGAEGKLYKLEKPLWTFYATLIPQTYYGLKYISQIWFKYWVSL